MKRLFLLIAVCMIGMVVPQGMWADYHYSTNDGTPSTLTIDVVGDKVTIECNQAGALENFLKQNTDEASNAISEVKNQTANGTIELKGTFEAKDLDELKRKNCCVQSTVDMSDAQFVRPDGQPDYNGMKFKNWKDYVTEAISSNHAEGFVFRDDHPFKDCKKLTSITLGSGSFSFSMGNQSDYPDLETINVKEGVTRLGGQWGFCQGFTSLKTLNIDTGGTSPLEFGFHCFNGCTGLTNESLEHKRLLIPSRTTLIDTMAFGSTGFIDITFEAPTAHVDPLVIKCQAFENCKRIRNVYVNVKPSLKAMVCEYNAFDFDAMDGQTKPAKYEDMATLHFDEGDKEFYKGEWKEGFGFTQTELLAIRGQSNGTSETILEIGLPDATVVAGVTSYADLQNDGVAVRHTGEEYNGYEYGYLTNRPANGWQQFAKTGNEIPITGNFLRSYSTSKPYEMPTYGTSGTPIVKIYRIWKFDDGYTGTENTSDEDTDTGKKIAYAKSVDGYIPAETGLIMVGITQQDVLYNFKLLDTKTIEDYQTYPFSDVKTKGECEVATTNLLVPSNDDTLIIGPTDKSGNEITHRNFGFKVSSVGQTKTGNFLRAKPETKIKPNHAYLKLYKDIFHWRNETGGTSNYDEEIYGAVSSTGSKISFFYALDEDEEFSGGIATIIRKAIEEADMEDGEFYTLQGVKVSKPTTKGVYIHNGKKVLIK